eukprot:3937951-Rhodomonas_salina.1
MDVAIRHHSKGYWECMESRLDLTISNTTTPCLAVDRIPPEHGCHTVIQDSKRGARASRQRSWEKQRAIVDAMRRGGIQILRTRTDTALPEIIATKALDSPVVKVHAREASPITGGTVANSMPARRQCYSRGGSDETPLHTCASLPIGVRPPAIQVVRAVGGCLDVALYSRVGRRRLRCPWGLIRPCGPG